MQPPRAIFGFVLITVLGFGLTFDLAAQERRTGAPKRLAPGVLKTIPLEMQTRDMYSLPMPMPGVKATKFAANTIPIDQTLYGTSRSVIMFRENVWQYEFAFTGLRQAKLQVPSSRGSISRKNFWYIVFRIRDTGKTLSFDKIPEITEEEIGMKIDEIKSLMKRDQPIAADKKNFFPRFSLEGSVPTEKGYKRVAYADTINPIVVEQIKRREDPNQRLLDTYQMSRAKIPVAKTDSDPGVWGVAIFEDVDPNLDYVSVYVKGLTNAFRLNKDVNADSKLKTLQLNFWRAGDSVAEAADNVVFGIPLVDDSRRQILICKQYNLPGPIFRIYKSDKTAKTENLIAEADGQVNLSDFQSALVPTLNQGRLPKEISETFNNAGVPMNARAALTTVIEGEKWTIQEGGETFTIILEPQFWAPDFDGIKFIKSLDHMWIYR